METLERKLQIYMHNLVFNKKVSRGKLQKDSSTFLSIQIIKLILFHHFLLLSNILSNQIPL